MTAAAPDRAAEVMRPTLSEALRCWRRTHGHSLRAAAEVLGVSQGAVLRWERGAAPRPLLLPAIASALGVDVLEVSGMTPTSRVHRPETSGGSRSTGVVLARLRLGMTQADLARALNVSFATMSKWECGLIRPHAHDRARIAAVLRASLVDVDQWFATAPPSSRDTVGRLPGLAARLAELGLDVDDLALVTGATHAESERWVKGRSSVPTSVWPAVAAIAQVDELTGRSLMRRRPTVEPPAGLVGRRRRLGLSQRAVAATTGLAVSRLARLENDGSTASPSEVRRLARVLRCPDQVVAEELGVDLTPVRIDAFGSDDSGALFVALRDAAGLRRHQAARALAVTSVTVKRWESGERLPRAGSWEWIARVYDIDAAELSSWLADNRRSRSGQAASVTADRGVPATTLLTSRRTASPGY